MLVVITKVEHVFGGAVFPDLLIQCGPVLPALFGVDLMLKLIQFWMMFMDPIKNSAFVIPAQVQVFQPNQIALMLRPFDDCFYIRDSRKNRRNKTSSLDPLFIKLFHRREPSLNADTPVHFFAEFLIQRVDGP